MKSLAAKQIITVLKRDGFVLSRQKGSHAIWKNPKNNRMVIVPMHGGNKPIPIGTCRQIIKQSGIPEEQYYKRR